MEKDLLQDLLAEIFGQLEGANPKEVSAIKEGMPLVAQAMKFQSAEESQSEKLSIQSADFFFRERMSKPRQIELEKVVKEAVKVQEKEPNTKVFVREIPIRTSQIKSSVPAWAVGAKVDKTIGPITRVDGLQVFLDVYRVEKLIALRKQNTNEPFILFKSSFTKPRFQTLNAPPIEVLDSYKVLSGTVWVQVKLFDSSAPSDRYFGLKVKGGQIDLTAAPVAQGSNLVLGATTQVNVNLELDSPSIKGSKSKKKYGSDAADLSLQLPDKLRFRFRGNGVGQIQASGNAKWEVYGEKGAFQFANKQPVFNSQLNRFCIPFNYSKGDFEPLSFSGKYFSMEGKSSIKASFWAIPAGAIDTNAPLEAAGIGGMVQHWEPGISCNWKGLKGGSLPINESLFLVEEGRIAITSLDSGNAGISQDFDHWKDAQNPYGTSVNLKYTGQNLFLYNCVSSGTELVISQADAVLSVDRPKQVNGHAVSVKTKKSLVLLGGGELQNLFYLIDDNILWDNKLPFDKVPKFKSLALALENALFTVSPVNGAMIFGKCDDAWEKITQSQTYLVFGMISYLPTLPDPYLANLGILNRFIGKQTGELTSIKSWLICRIIQKPIEDKDDEVSVSFHFGPQNLNQSNQNAVANNLAAESPVNRIKSTTKSAFRKDVPDYETAYNQAVSPIGNDYFTLLDVSSNANQIGVSYGGNPGFSSPRKITATVTHVSESEAVVSGNTSETLLVDGMEVKVPGYMARIFLLPQVAWEPVQNLTPPPPPEQAGPMDPPAYFNYYPNDGGPSRLLNSNSNPVTLAPIPLTSFVLENFKLLKTEVIAQFTLPFGLKAVAQLSQSAPYNQLKPKLENIRPNFPNDLTGGIQLRAIGGDAGKKIPDKVGMDDFPMFDGFTFQINNVLNIIGAPSGASTLGDHVTKIFNGEFSTINGDPKGVPVVSIDFSGYGASTFSNWLSPSAAIASTSQARFDIMLGRTGHEVIQVKSLVYPWGIRVVRTITLFRTSSGYVYRVDSGWQPESDGRFDFTYSFVRGANSVEVVPYKIHPGTLRGLYNIRNITEDASIGEFERTDLVKKGEKYIDILGVEQTWNDTTPKEIKIICAPVFFDADVELENLVQGHKNNRTPAKKILGYVQLSPTGFTLTPERFKELINLQGGSLGGDIDCVMDVNKSGQLMRISRFDFSNSVATNGSDPIFVASARGSVLLPKTGSWTTVQHQIASGEVSPLPPHIPVPLIRIGEWDQATVVKDSDVNSQLLRLANPTELLRAPNTNTINYGLLQTTSTQKALVLTPSFAKGNSKLLSKTPLLYADAYRLMSGNGIFPNIGNAIDDFGKAVALTDGLKEGQNVSSSIFKENPTFVDGGVKVLELLAILSEKQGDSLVDSGFKLIADKTNSLAEKALAFDMPPWEVVLVEMESLKIYIDYKTQKSKSSGTYVDSKLNFDINSFANDAAETWKNRLNNIAMVVDLGSFKRLMTIKGNFDSNKGSESSYKGGPDSNFPSIGYPSPEIEFSDALQPVIDLLQMLMSLSQGKYADVMKKGLQIAMSNAGEIWEYKFEASKEIPLVRFPPEENLYNNPTTPLKLEAGLELGVYFNAALKVTDDPKQLLPTAGAYIQFNGGLEVMCVTVGGATVFAVGEVVLKVACDTKIGPSLLMRFGFGASIAVGLPVVGNVSVTYIVGCELYADLTQISVTAYMLFKGRASLVGGLVSVTIYIEASGTITRLIAEDRTECTASVTFGIEISICFVINIDFEETWEESRQIA
ncbi:MAG: hypothetical protein P8O16_05535 [Algoriphagus sp.]|uniref:hypothetical protein n=1 Tax=Algoriphagus sp. TaxID=1872435 RepID=UPI0026330FD7|nr:hypothetical protein [Algoriphagus sp.]MDG1276723.1 hypothetical protein [Algoriphagus sp.]